MPHEWSSWVSTALYSVAQKTRPASAAIELGRGRKGVQVTSGAGKNALPLLMQKRAGERTLGPLLAQDRILIGRERRAPVRVSADDVGRLGSRAPGQQEICARNCGQAAQSRSTREHPPPHCFLRSCRIPPCSQRYTF